jgi:hypothetical protein
MRKRFRFLGGQEVRYAEVHHQPSREEGVSVWRVAHCGEDEGVPVLGSCAAGRAAMLLAKWDVSSLCFVVMYRSAAAARDLPFWVS